MKPHHLLWAGLAVTAVLLAAAVRMTVVHPPDRSRDLPGRFDSPVIALEMARSSAEVAQIAGGKDSPSWRMLRRHVLDDNWFLVCYGALFALLGLLLMRRSLRLCRALGWLVVAGAVSGAVFDWLENRALLAALDGQPVLDHLRLVSLWKWSLVGVVSLAVSGLFMRPLPLDSRLKVYVWAVSCLYLLAGLILLYGIVDPYALERCVGPLSAAILIQSVVLLGPKKRREFLDSL